MEQNNIIAAPQIANVSETFSLWKRSHTGSLSKFYEFITTPSSERARFIAGLNREMTFNGSVVSVTIQP